MDSEKHVFVLEKRIGVNRHLTLEAVFDNKSIKCNVSNDISDQVNRISLHVDVREIPNLLKIIILSRSQAARHTYHSSGVYSSKEKFRRDFDIPAVGLKPAPYSPRTCINAYMGTSIRDGSV